MSELDPVQIAALEASDGHAGFGYFMEMGLGKSLTTLADFQRLVHRGEVTRLVVVCPNSFKSGWVDEINKHEIPVTPHIFISGGENNAFLNRTFDAPPILIVNYEAIRRPNTQDEIIRFASKKPSMIVFDESIQLKTHNSQQTKAGIALSQFFQHQRILTGKPITQGPHDLWGQMRCIGQLVGKNYYAFRGMFCRMGGWQGKQVIGAQNEEFLAKLIDPHVFRATKAEWGFHVGKVSTIREYKMTPAMESQYRSMEQEFVLWLNDQDSVTIDAAITKYIKLAQIQAGFIIDESGKVHELVEPDKNPRILLLRDIIEDEITGKVIVVYVHRYSLDMLLRVLENKQPAVIKGMMSVAELDAEKHRFNDDPNCRAILVQATAGKYGHTLLGGPEPNNRCATTIFFENGYSLDTRSQIEDRNHRRGQIEDSVLYVDLCGTSLDRNVIRALQRKEAVYQSVFMHLKKKAA